MVDGAGLGLGPLLAPLALERGRAAPRAAAGAARDGGGGGADCGDDREEAREGCVLVPAVGRAGPDAPRLWVRVGASRDAGAVKRQLEADTGVAARDQVLAPNKAAPFTDRTPVSLLTSAAPRSRATRLGGAAREAAAGAGCLVA